MNRPTNQSFVRSFGRTDARTDGRTAVAVAARTRINSPEPDRDGGIVRPYVRLSSGTHSLTKSVRRRRQLVHVFCFKPTQFIRRHSLTWLTIIHVDECAPASSCSLNGDRTIDVAILYSARSTHARQHPLERAHARRQA
eukprot:GHVU01209917.1.p1 GENE.GHVU01209917.1~~GHVU01209917.1.p1  ORF type:complete len:139 (+),score=2.24 GHVU01209917.1:273-689(+)